MSTSSSEQTPNELIDAALANEPIELPIDYGPLVDKRGKSEIVATRIAQNVGPLLGVPYPHGPFGEASWLRNVSDMTLDEIARGALRPSSEEMKGRKITPATLKSRWEWVGDGIYGDTPNTIVSATLNKHGPETIPAVILAGINRLLEPQTAAIDRAVRSDQFKTLSTEERLHAYAGMLFGVYRPQPFLVETGFAARAIQRVLGPTLHLPVSPQLKNRRFARCEFPAVEGTDRPILPFDLELIDKTGASVAFGLPRRPRPSIVIDPLVKAFRTHAGFTTWDYSYDPEIRQETVRASGDPDAIISEVTDQVTPFTLWKRVPPL